MSASAPSFVAWCSRLPASTSGSRHRGRFAAPYGILEVNAEKKVRFNFEVASRFTSYDNKRLRKTYAYFGAAVDTPQSWTDNDNSRIRQISRVAFDRLTAVLLNDL